MPDDRICPEQPGRPAEGLGHCLFGREATSERTDRLTHFALSEQSGGQLRSPGQGLFQPGDLGDVDADANDHALSLP